MSATETVSGPWLAVTALVDWLDRNDPLNNPEMTKVLRCFKVAEETGEVAAAIIGATGQNPRKGQTHTWDDVQSELCDVILSGMVALASISPDAEAVFARHVMAILVRASRSGARTEPGGGQR